MYIKTKIKLSPEEKKIYRKERDKIYNKLYYNNRTKINRAINKKPLSDADKRKCTLRVKLIYLRRGAHLTKTKKTIATCKKYIPYYINRLNEFEKKLERLDCEGKERIIQYQEELKNL